MIKSRRCGNEGDLREYNRCCGDYTVTARDIPMPAYATASGHINHIEMTSES